MAGNTTKEQIDLACIEAAHAFDELGDGVPGRGVILESIADALENKREEVLRVCSEETALTVAELTPEFARMTGTLRMFSQVIREGSWVRAAIDTPTQNPIGPNHDTRRMLLPLGPVAVFGSSNFPLAYGVCGGDTASALAAGCSVIVKEHPAHPETGRLISQIAQEAIRTARPDASLLGYLHNKNPKDFSVAQQLVQHPAITAVGFTGSVRGGIAVLNLASGRKYGDGWPRPIPVFAEMGSCNVLIVLGHAFDQRREQIADEITASLLARVGQQCTAPGILLVAGYERADWMYAALKERISLAPARRMLSAGVAANYYHRIDAVVASGIIERHTPLPTKDQRNASLGVPVLLGTQAVKMEDTPTVWEEIFGPALVVAGCGSLASGYFFSEGALAVSIYADPDDDVEDMNTLIDESFIGPTSKIASYIRSRAGRIIFNGVPTGVRVAHGMVHGGPFPATNRPDTTAVGPMAIERWCRPVCFQNCPDGLLPEELRNANPRGIWRMINGELTRGDVS